MGLLAVPPVLDVWLLCRLSRPKEGDAAYQEDAGDRNKCKSSHDGSGFGESLNLIYTRSKSTRNSKIAKVFFYKRGNLLHMYASAFSELVVRLHTQIPKSESKHIDLLRKLY